MASTDPIRWHISVSSPLQAVIDDPNAPGELTRPLRLFTTWQIRNETPIAKVIATPQLAAPWVAALIALGAQVQREDGTSAALAQAMYRRAPWDTLTLPRDGWTFADAYVARAPTDAPIVYAAAATWVEGGTLRGIRLALTGVSRLAVYVPKSPSQWMGNPFDEAAVHALAQAVAQEVRPRGDFRGSEAYRRAMTEVLVRRVLTAKT